MSDAGPRTPRWPPPPPLSSSKARPPARPWEHPAAGPGRYSHTKPPEPDPEAETPREGIVASPSEISSVQAIVDDMRFKLADDLRKIAIAVRPDADLSAALTLTQRSLTRWRMLGALLGTLLGLGGAAGTAVVARETGADDAATAVERRVGDLERRFDSIEDKLDAALERR